MAVAAISRIEGTEREKHFAWPFPWAFARFITGTHMIEINVYFFQWLGSALAPLTGVSANRPRAAYLQSIICARLALEGFAYNTDLTRAFPRTADAANELLAVINSFVPPVGDPIADLDSPIPEFKVEQLKAIYHGLQAALRDEAQRDYVIKVEDQRCLSKQALVENIQTCFSTESWNVICAEAKREFTETGKCLALERYTGAGFHALRGVECVIRQYIIDLTGELPRKRDWGSYVETLRQKAADPSLIAVIDNIRTHERNPLMHPEDWLEIDDAITLFTLSQAVVSRLTSDMQKKCPSRYS